MKDKKIITAAALAALSAGALVATGPQPAQARGRQSDAAAAAAAPAPAERVLTSLLVALKNDDYKAFVADGEAPFKAVLTKPMLAEVSAQAAPRLKRGYQVTYLGALNQKGYQVYLWKLIYADGGDDSLVSLSLRAGKIGGFFIN
ncbi:MAG: hypothetical protein JO250_11405 [Armatimonadetes bacterium]|nr:hypothetical protein [Armatimonadota bacterium]